jgi:aspartate kinase
MVKSSFDGHGNFYFFVITSTKRLKMSGANRIVCKFGGSSVADASQFHKIRSIIEQDPRRKIVVVSAPGKRNASETKLTDLLYATHDLALKGLDFTDPFNRILTRFQEIASELNLKTGVDQDLLALKKELDANPKAITTDYLVSRGEYLNARLMAEFLGATFVDAADLIRFDAHFRVSNEDYDAIASKLSGSGSYVVPGFYGLNQKGILKTFSRGGSDITGAILARAIGAQVYENWTDVSGLLMADPRIINNPKPMSYLSYREIRELAYSGANVFHDEAIAPCKERNIPINIRNTNDPLAPGSTIGPAPATPNSVVTGIAGRKNFVMIYIEKTMMNKEKGFGRKVLGILENHGVSYEHSPSGIDSMSIVVEKQGLEPVQELVLEELQKQMEPDYINVFENLALIATVGHGMSHHVGTAAKLFQSLAQAQVNVRIIDQGSSEINIIIGVEGEDFEKAIHAIYTAFVGS